MGVEDGHLQVTSLHVDFETRGTIDLREVGVDVYSRHPDTDAWCMAYALHDHTKEHDVCLVTPDDFCKIATALARFLAAGCVVVAHNAAFELAIWNNIMVPRYGWPRLDPKQVRCTMAMAYAMSLPGSLEKAAAAVGIKEQKDLAGGRLMLQMCRPRLAPKPGSTDPAGQDSHEQKVQWWDEPEKLARLYDYCKQDVRVERELEKRLLALSATEQRIWNLDYDINQRGVYIDRPAIEAAIKVVEHEAARLNGAMRSATGNFVGFTSEVARLTQWIRDRGVVIPGVAKADVLDSLADDGLPDEVRTALLIRQEAGKSSTAKLKKMLTAVSADGRIRNTTQYHGAGPGRWTGRRIQPHNMPRGAFLEGQMDDLLDRLIRMPTADWIRYVEVCYGSPLDMVSWCLRGFICAAPGHELISNDFTNIQGRILPWLADEEWKLDAFRAQDEGTGPEIYIIAAAKIYGVAPREITKKDPRRQVGKVSELALGFGGGVGAFQTMARGYNVEVSDTVAEDTKQRWRAAHPKIVQFWYDLEWAAIRAVLNPGQAFGAGHPERRIKFKVRGSFLWCCLPSGRLICYPYPRVLPVETPWGEVKDALTYRANLDSQARKKAKIVDDPSNGGDWWRIATYGGSIAENVDMGIERDLLAYAMVRLADAGANVVLHCHDEAVIEVKQSAPVAAQRHMAEIMMQPHEWSAGLPIAVEGWRGRRYRK